MKDKKQIIQTLMVITVFGLFALIDVCRDAYMTALRISGVEKKAISLINFIHFINH
jgi:hypothetical protein